MTSKRTIQEIERALLLLEEQDIYGADVIESVLTDQLSESEVFDRYMRVPEDDRNEDAYYVGRDAAQWLVGKISLADVIPGEEDLDPQEIAEEPEGNTITISRAVFEELMERIEKLEYWTGMKRRVQPKKLPPLPADANPNDYIIQKEAASLMGLSKHGIRGYVNRGELNAYQDNRFVKFKKDEVMELVKKERKTNGNHERSSRNH